MENTMKHQNCGRTLKGQLKTLEIWQALPCRGAHQNIMGISSQVNALFCFRHIHLATLRLPLMDSLKGLIC